MRKITRENNNTVCMYNYEDRTYLIDIDDDVSCYVVDKEYRLLDYTDAEMEVFMKSIDNGLMDRWDEITEIR